MNPNTDASFSQLNDRLARIDANIDLLLKKQTVKEWYSTADFASLYGRDLYTVREWCRLGRIKAQKGNSRGGREAEWRIPHEERLRYERDGLLPPGREFPYR